jgi:S1-C subfamily serine protease
MSTQIKSKPVTAFLIFCLIVIFGSTLYVASIAYREHKRSQYQYFVYSSQFTPVAETAARGAVAIKTTLRSAKAELVVNNAGSGFLFQPDGYVITNEHVIHNVDEIRVTLADGSQHLAEVIGADSRDDLAILKIDAEDLPYIPLARADDLALGQIVIALGNPLGSGEDGQAVITYGQIVRLGQSLSDDIDAPNDRYYDNLIQSDAFTLPGSSGGPLINTQGKVIGVSTAMGKSLESGRHFGFAITLNAETLAKIDLLKSGQDIKHAYLGVKPVEVDESTRQQLALADLSGALLEEVYLGFPAQMAGLLPGDVIVSIDNITVHRPDDVFRYLHNARADQTIDIEVRRAQAKRHAGSVDLTVQAKLTQRMLADLQGSTYEAGLMRLEVPDWGLHLKPLTNWRRDRMKLPPHLEGVLIYHVFPGSPAEKSGHYAGQVITHLGQYRIADLDEFAASAGHFTVMPALKTVSP